MRPPRAIRSVAAAGFVALVAVATQADAEPVVAASGAPTFQNGAPLVPENVIRVSRATPTVDPVLLRAFDALNGGDLGAAAAGYGQVLAAAPESASALHGLAAVALRRGEPEQAEDFFLRAVEADPKDAIAHAGLSGLRGQADPVDAESRLKNLIAAQPRQHVLRFALGNVYASAGRWSEARQAFFSAYSADGDQPDYLFNLAVSFEHLRQPSAAARYYERALAAARRRPAGFEPALAAARLRQLRP